MLLAENRMKLKRVKYRFLLALCLCDVLNSLWFVFWSLPIPKDTPGVWGALGNKASCDAQGAFFQFGIIGSFYNGALALYFYMSLCYNMRDEQIAERNEKWIHVVSILWCLGTAIAAWQQDLYSFSGLECYIAPEPLRCHRRDDVDCIRGEDAYIYAWFYGGIPEILLCMCIVYAMVMIYLKVREVSRRAEKWSIRMAAASIVCNTNPTRVEVTQSPDRNIHDGSLRTQSQTSEVASQRGSISGNNNRGRSRNAERTKEAAWQGFLYVLAYAVTHMWCFIVVLIEMGGGTTPFFLVLIQNLCWPLQGFANVFIFLRPRIQSIQKSSPEISCLTAAHHSVFHYDEVHQRLTESVISPVSPDEGNTTDSFRKSSGEGGDTFRKPSLTKLPEAAVRPTEELANESRHGKEEDFQPVILEEASSHYDADEEPTIAEDTLFSQITENDQQGKEHVILQ